MRTEIGKWVGLSRPLPLSARPMTEALTLIPLDAVDPALIEQLLDRAFEPTRKQRTAYKLRDGADWLLL